MIVAQFPQPEPGAQFSGSTGARPLRARGWGHPKAGPDYAPNGNKQARLNDSFTVSQRSAAIAIVSKSPVATPSRRNPSLRIW
jgi:hypothetical protein